MSLGEWAEINAFLIEWKWLYFCNKNYYVPQPSHITSGFFSEVSSELCQTSKMELFEEIVMEF